MNAFAVSSIFEFVFNLAMAILVFWKGKNHKVSVLWGIFCVVATIWGLGAYNFSITTSHEIAFFWWKFSYICVIFAPIVYLHVVCRLVKRNFNYILILGYALSFFYCYLTFFRVDLFLGDLRFVFNQFYWHDWFNNKSIYHVMLYITHYWIIIFFSFYLKVQRFRDSFGFEREQLKYFIIAMGFCWFGTHTDFAIDYGVNIYPYTNFLLSLYTGIVTYTIIRYNLMDIRIVVTRVGIFLVTYGIILGIPIWLGFGLGKWVAALALMALLATVGPVTYNHIRIKAERLIFQKEKLDIVQHEQVRRHKAMDHFSASLAHEIDNPVYAIMGLAEVIRLNLVEDLKGVIPKEKTIYLQDKFTRLIGDVRRVSKMIKAIREFSSQDKGEFKDLEVDNVISSFCDIIEPQFKYEGINFKKDIETGMKVYGNKIQLEEVFVNISLNAMHAVKYNEEKEKLVELKVYKRNQKCVIEFKDTGYGIKEELLEDIFLDFVTTKASTEGAGIGLSRARKIVTNHDGRIWAQSDGPGEGAVFYVELPVIKEDPRSTIDPRFKT